ncbi:hypothetical protein C035_01499 [Brucella melitensis R3/07-2]|nr:hypothetical protein DK62_698 [Brucella melitensis bv. 3 str. Ether]ENQ88697.1 hypothetical protein C061_01892 [Brucella melitensis F5/07-239A]ENQ95808.1 hypothetical protein C035_01499 [Brucella melitensis R3/07-2]ENS90005.1 hypothetical protein B984_01076 [Brucella melitensis UK31/99]ENT74258.1 hypothetical protein D628_01059 [Brucella melitensis F15/06-7]SPU60355.1 Uncharacterised protein [Brucella melitensis]
MLGVALTGVFQAKAGNADRCVKALLALHGDGLKRNRLPRTAGQDIGAEADADCGIGGCADITPLQCASRANRRRPDGPGEAATIDEADIDADLGDGAVIVLQRAAATLGLEYTINILTAADDDTDRR